MLASTRAALVAIGVLLAAAPAGAQTADGAAADEEGRMRFQLGQTYYQQGRFAEAAVEFEAAYRASGRDALLYNMYVAHRDAGDVEAAADALRRYLATDHPAASQRGNLESRLANLERQLAEGEAASSAPSPTSGAGSTSPLPLIGGILAGVGAAAVLASIGTGVVALDNEARLAEACPMDRCDASQRGLIDETATLGVATDVLWVSGAILAAGGVALLVVGLLGGSNDAASARVVPAVGCGPGGCVAAVEGRF